MLLAENRDLKDKVKAVSMVVDDVTNRNVQLLAEKEALSYLNEHDSGGCCRLLNFHLPTFPFAILHLVLKRFEE